MYTQGEENLDNDFYLKENPDGTIVFESVPNKGRYINVTQGNLIIRNFSVNVLVSVHARIGLYNYYTFLFVISGL